MKRFTLGLALCLALVAAPTVTGNAEGGGRLVMFVGVDISGSFMRGKHFKDALRFLATYIHAHLNGYGGLEEPHSLFVGPLGGQRPDEAKTFYPIETFRGESIDGIHRELVKMFPKTRENPFTDYNAFFKQVASYVKSRKLILKPISIVMLSDGAPDLPKEKGEKAFRLVDLNELELLSRNVTLRLLYTNAVLGENWKTMVKRRRIRIWTQDAVVMKQWSDSKIYKNGTPAAEQTAFFDWVKNNVDFLPPAQAVN